MTHTLDKYSRRIIPVFPFVLVKDFLCSIVTFGGLFSKLASLYIPTLMRFFKKLFIGDRNFFLVLRTISNTHFLALHTDKEFINTSSENGGTTANTRFKQLPDFFVALSQF